MNVKEEQQKFYQWSEEIKSEFDILKRTELLQFELKCLHKRMKFLEDALVDAGVLYRVDEE